MTFAGPPTFGDLLHRATSLVLDGRRAVLGIAGAPGAGKSHFAERLLAALSRRPPPGLGAEWVAYLPMDGFHLAGAEILRLGRSHRKGAPDTFDAEGFAAIVARLAADPDRTVYAPQFERDLEEPIAGRIAISSRARLVITEGNYLLLGTPPWDRIRPQLREVWFCDTDERRRRDQLVRRHVVHGRSHDAAVEWAERSDESNARLVAATRHLADLLIPDAVLREQGAPEAPAAPGWTVQPSTAP